MKNQLAAALDAIHRQLGSTKLGTKLALKLRNQSNAVIRAHLNSGTDPTRNGEALLMAHIAPYVRTFFDVGANQGQWAKEALVNFPAASGVCFEPLPSVHDCLNDVLSGQKRVIWKALAIGDVPAIMNLYECEPYSEMSSLVEMKDLHQGRAHSVRVSTVELEAKELCWAELDFLKIDVEGYDFNVLRGAGSLLDANAIGIIQFEYSGFWRKAGSTLDAARTFLENRGYEVYLLRRNGICMVPYEPWGDYFGYSNYVAVSKDWKKRVLGILRR